MKTMSECLRRDKQITSWMIGIHVFMAVLLSLLFTAITGMPVIGVALGVIIWTLVLFKTPVFNWTFINVKPNWAIIMGNQVIHDELSDDPKARIKMFDLASMREVGPGLRGRFPTEVVYDSVDLQSELVIGNSGQGGKLLQCYTSDNIPLEIEWQVILTPLRGFLVNLVRKGEEASQAYFRGQLEQHLIKWVKSKKEGEIFSQLDNLKKEFGKVFGGENTVDKKEMEYGFFTNTPQILQVKRSSRYQNAAEGVMIGKRMKLVIDGINKEFKNHKVPPDPNMVLATAATLVGNEVSGLLLIPGLSGKGQDATAMLAAATRATETLKKKGNK